MNIEEDIQRLDQGIRLLKVHYDQYFAGALPRQPLELRSQVEQLIRKYSNAEIRKFSHRFHFNTLVSRFNTFSELWAKHLRAIEEGRSPGLAAERAEAGAAGEASAAADDVVFQDVFTGSEVDGAVIRRCYDKYLEQQRSRGGDEMSFANFSRQIVRKTEAVQSRAECDGVRLRMTRDGDRLLFKALPVRRKRKP